MNCWKNTSASSQAKSEERIKVVAATPDEGAILGIPPGAPLLSVVRTTVDAAGVPIEHSHDLFRADRTRITIHPHDGATVSSSHHPR